MFSWKKAIKFNFYYGTVQCWPLQSLVIFKYQFKLFTAEHLYDIQQDLDLSNTQTRVLAHDLRIASGSRKVVESGFKEKLTSHSMDDYFEENKIKYIQINKETKVSENIEQNTVICTGLPNLIDTF